MIHLGMCVERRSYANNKPISKKKQKKQNKKV